jgi:hypothetical protein
MLVRSRGALVFEWLKSSVKIESKVSERGRGTNGGLGIGAATARARRKVQGFPGVAQMLSCCNRQSLYSIQKACGRATSACLFKRRSVQVCSARPTAQSPGATPPRPELWGAHRASAFRRAIGPSHIARRAPTPPPQAQPPPRPIPRALPLAWLNHSCT